MQEVPSCIPHAWEHQNYEEGDQVEEENRMKESDTLTYSVFELPEERKAIGN